MTSLVDSIRHALGLTAAQRGRELFETSAQHDGERFRNVKPRPVEGIGKMLGITWNLLFNKPEAPCPSMRSRLNSSAPRLTGACTALGIQPCCSSCVANSG
jgi:hypothetical protein